MWPHRRQPTRLSCPWDSPGKSTGVGCHFLLQCMKVKSEREVARLCPTLHDPMDCSLPGSLSMRFSRPEHWSWLPFLLQGIFPTQGSNPCLLLSRRIPYHLSHQGSPLLPCNIPTISLSYDCSTLPSTVLTCMSFCQWYSLSWSILSIVYLSVSIFKNTYLFIWLHWILVAAHGIFDVHCNMWYL